MITLDNDKLFALMRDFYELAGIKICLFDENFREVASYPARYSPFCELVRQSPEGARQCDCSNLHAFETCRKLRTGLVYRCHMNMVEAASPVFADGGVVGYVMIGQARGEPDPDSAAIAQRAGEFGLDALEAERRYRSLPYFTHEKIAAASHILDACAGYLYLDRIVAQKPAEIQRRILEYIDEHLHSPISVDELCTAFHCSRAELYRLFDVNFGTSVAKLVKNRRMRLAAEYLAQTSDPPQSVADCLGMFDYGYFAKLFKAEYGLSPRAYRKACLTDPESVPAPLPLPKPPSRDLTSVVKKVIIRNT